MIRLLQSISQGRPNKKLEALRVGDAREIIEHDISGPRRRYLHQDAHNPPNAFEPY